MTDAEECEVCLRPATHRTVKFPWRYLCASHADTARDRTGHQTGVAVTPLHSGEEGPWITEAAP